MRAVLANKPLCHESYHYQDEYVSPELIQRHLGSVWQTDEGGQWSAFCTLEYNYGPLGDFPNRLEAEAALEGAVAAPAGTVGENLCK
jgi:hypothetical protein